MRDAVLVAPTSRASLNEADLTGAQLERTDQVELVDAIYAGNLKTPI